MLIVLARRMGGTDQNATYEVEVRINNQVVWTGELNGHDRREGWPVLLNQLAWTTMQESWKCQNPKCKCENLGSNFCHRCGKERVTTAIQKRDEQ